MNSGIYVILNIQNLKLYIGSSHSLSTRITSHKSDLERNKHHNTHLQRAYNKYESENFVFSIVEIVEDVNNLIPREQAWINAYDWSFLYNSSPTAGSVLDCIKPNSQTVFMYNVITKERLGTYPTMAIAARETKIAEYLIKSMCAKTMKSHGKIWFCFEGNEHELHTIDFSKNLDICQIQPATGKIIRKFTSAQEAADSLDLATPSIYHAIKKEMYLYGGYFWCREGDEHKWSYDAYQRQVSQDDKTKRKRIPKRIIEQRTMDGKLVDTFTTTREIQEKLGFKASSIRCCLSNIYNSSQGYRWVYVTNPDYSN